MNHNDQPGLFEIEARSGGLVVARHAAPNARMYSWGHIAAQVLCARNLAYLPSHMYVEFANLGDPDERVSPPTTAPTDGLDYYAALADSPDADFLRVRLAPAGEIDLDPDYSGLLADNLGNRAWFRADAVGVAGVHGKPFGPSHGSLIYGVAIAAAPGPDWSGDVLFARAYYPSDRQFAPAANLQIGVRYRTTFGTPSDGGSVG